MPFTKENARQLGQLGGLTSWARNRDANLRMVRAAARKREASFANQSARKLYYQRFSQQGVAARQAKRTQEQTDA